MLDYRFKFIRTEWGYYEVIDVILPTSPNQYDMCSIRRWVDADDDFCHMEWSTRTYDVGGTYINALSLHHMHYWPEIQRLMDYIWPPCRAYKEEAK